jgi:ATP-binding cassette subfamily B protein
MFKLLRFLKPFAPLITLVLILVFLHSLSELYLPTLMSNIVDTGIAKGDTRYILRIGGLMLLVAAGGVACSILASLLSARAGMGFGRDLRGAVFSHVQGF